MNKRIKNKLIATLVLGGLLIPSIPASARQIAELHEFKLPAWQGVVYTGQLEKASDNGYWVMNITENELAWTSLKYTVHTYLANTNGDMRSDYTVLSGTSVRAEMACSGKAGYLYHAVLMNGYSTIQNNYITGSWSPDNK